MHVHERRFAEAMSRPLRAGDSPFICANRARRRPHSARHPPPSGPPPKGAPVLTRRTLLKSAIAAPPAPPVPLALSRRASTPAAVEGFAGPLPLLPKARPVAKNSYLITARQGTEVMHPAFGRTTVWGYDDNSGR